MKLAALVVLLCGCSALVRPVPPNWNHASDPQCTETYGYPVADDLLAGAVAGGGILIADQIGDRHAAAVIAIGGLAAGVVFAIVSDVGYGEVHDCRIASEAWRTARAMTTRAPADWFCDSDGACARERSTCEQSGGSCTAAETVWCFATTDGDEQCYAAPDACWPARRKAGDAAASGCRRR